MASIKIGDLYNEVFGVKPKYLIPRRGTMDLVSAPDYKGIELFDVEETAFSVSELGTPIMDMLLIQSGSYNTFELKDGIPTKKKVSYPAYQFELWPMIDVSQDKVIVTTAINGRDGTIKEYIYTDDHQITIRGLLVGTGNNYPHDQRREMNAVFKVNTTYGVTSRLLNDLGIYGVVFKSINFQDLEGYNNVCQYTITALSDRIEVLDIKAKVKV